MIPRPNTEADMVYWGDMNPRTAIISGPGEVEMDIEPCPAIITEGNIVRVAWQLDEIELMHLANGGTLWLSTWGGLPIHAMEVQAP